jgi:glutamate N-acetyltransferase/amino-acid N-acetyltransferase
MAVVMLLSPYRLARTSVLAKPFPFQILCRSYSKFDLYGNSVIPAKKQKFVPKSGTYRKGFEIGSIHVGIKPDAKSQPDLVLVASEKPSCGAAVFTKNEFAAPSITVSRELLRKTKGYGLRGVIANSRCANLLTGEVGLEDSLAMSKEASNRVSGETDEVSVMVMHTGMGGIR